MIKDPLISVVIPVYNIQEYVEKAIKSVLSQDIGFEKHIELLLVDDGSTDESDRVCLEYSQRYPDNVVYVKKKNGGVSSARNSGLSKARGEYIHFLDGDDMMSNDFYRRTTQFLSEHKNEVDFVAVKMKFFDEIIDSHPLNFKFDTTRVINLKNQPNNPILHVISGVFRRSSLKNITFDEKLSIAEDMKFVSDVLSKRGRYGVVSSATYHYRKRSDGNSAIGTSRRNKASYTDVVRYIYSHMLDVWPGNNTFAEYAILYDLSYRLDQKEQSILTPSEEKAYIDAIFGVADRISDQAIIQTQFLSASQKIFLLRQKYGKKFSNHISTHGGAVYFKDYVLWSIGSASVFIDFLTPLGGDRYKIEGYIRGVTDLDCVSYLVSNGKRHKELRFVERFQREKSFLGYIYDKGGAFEAELALPVGSALSVQIGVGSVLQTLPLGTGRYTRFGALKWTYRCDPGKLLRRQPNKIAVHRYSRMEHTWLELRMLAQILLNWRVGTFRRRFTMLRSRNLTHLSLKAALLEILKPFAFSVEAVVYIPRDIGLRVVYRIAKRLKKRPIWLISDRSMAARDNGEALFRYIMSRDNCPADVYFVLSKQSRDLERMQAIGPVMYQESLKFKLKFLLADKIISSQADIETTNPFIRLLDRYADLFAFDFIFLQHGVIRHNLSGWLNRFEKNITLFVTSAKKEHDSILSNPYYYPKDNVLLSGLPRYDYLESHPAKKLILAPTYRKNLVTMKTDRIGRRGYDPSFKHSRYREFYNNFINDKRLLDALKEHGMTGEFYLHPVFSEQRVDFDENEQFKMMQFPYDYQKAFREGDLLVSDHSSVVFDFAYLKKPVAYAHFDVDTFFAGHSYDESNFFSDEDDGFGGVYYDYDTLIEGVIRSIRGGCVMTEEYASRVDKFFYKVDKNNSERVYNAIIEQDNQAKTG